MRILLTTLILILNIQSWTKAEDIRNFQIEGMSIGDSLLNYFDKDLIDLEIKDKNSLMYKNNKYVQIGASSNKSYRLNIGSNKYDDLSIVLKTTDKTYKIYAIGGRIFCKKINDCKSKKKQIVSELESFFGKDVIVNNETKIHRADTTGNSKLYMTFFKFKSNDNVQVAVYDWSEEFTQNKKFYDNLKIMLMGSEFRDFLNNVQFKK